jgi:hypothetical protein
MLCIRYGGLSGLPAAGSHACVLFLRRFLIQRSSTVQSYLCQHAVFSRFAHKVYRLPFPIRVFQRLTYMPFSIHHHSMILHTAWMRPYPLLLLNAYIFLVSCPIIFSVHLPLTAYNIRVRSYPFVSGTICILSTFLIFKNKGAAVYTYGILSSPYLYVSFVVDNYFTLQITRNCAMELYTTENAGGHAWNCDLH